MAMEDIIEKAMTFIILFNFSVAIVGAMGIFPIQLGIAGFDVYNDINERINDITDSVTNFNMMEAGETAIILVTQIPIVLLEFLLLIVVGLPLVLNAVGVPLVITGLICAPVYIFAFYKMLIILIRSL